MSASRKLEMAHNLTIECARKESCLPCWYKLCPSGFCPSFSATEPSEEDIPNLIRLPPNQRPENCPRSSMKLAAKGEEFLSNGLYHSGQRILTVGDGDLSFSLALARSFASVTGHARNLTATTHESRDSVCKTYVDGAANIAELRSLGVTVWHQVDATTLETYEPLQNLLNEANLTNMKKEAEKDEKTVTSHDIEQAQMIFENAKTEKERHRAEKTLKKLQKKFLKSNSMKEKTNLSTVNDHLNGIFDVVIWNFPCVRVESGKDGQSSELQANIDLLSSFFTSVQPFLRRNRPYSSGCGASQTKQENDSEKDIMLHGEVHVVHKTLEPFSWWNIVGLAEKQGLECPFTMAFDRCLYPGYVNRKVLDKKSFPCNDARLFVFVPQEWKDGSRILTDHYSSVLCHLDGDVIESLKRDATKIKSAIEAAKLQKMRKPVGRPPAGYVPSNNKRTFPIEDSRPAKRSHVTF